MLSLPYPLLLRLYYAGYLLRFLPSYDMRRRRLGLPSLAEVDLQAFKRSDVVFILGSGESINRISAERWEAISNADTFGFNMWLYHRFVPRIYFHEDVFGSEQFDTEFLRLAAERSGDYRETIKVVMDLFQESHRTYVDELPAEWKENFFAAYTLTLMARSDEEFLYGLKFLNKRGCFRPTRRLSFLLKHCGTLSTMVTLAARMQYRTIVLCGVDLKNTRYFYQDPKLYPASKDVEFAPRNGTHPTLRKHSWSVVPIDVVLRNLRRELLDPTGVQLFVENRDSALWPEIPEAPQELFDQLRNVRVQPHVAGRGAGHRA